MGAADDFDPYHPYRSTLLSPQRVRELSTLRPGIAVRDALLCWLLIAAAWAVAAWDGRPWVCALAAIVVGTRYYGLFLIGHDGLHRRIFPTRAANDLFTDLVILGPIGAITRLNNRNHLAHHQHLGREGDPDRFKHACFNKTERIELAAFLVGLTSLGRAAHNVFVGNRARGDGYTIRDVAILGGWQVVLVGGLTWAFGWWGYPVMWLLPVFVFTYLADLCRSFVEHSHPEADAHADHHRLITFESNAIERWFFAPMHMNFHVAHHLWVGIPYYNLPQADAEMTAHPMARTLERRGSYLAYLWRYWRALPLNECKPHTPTVA
jgi:fatty acid desaturase